MSAVTISGGSIEHYQGDEGVLKLRIYLRKNFTTSDGEALVKGALDSEYFYKEVNCVVTDGVLAYDEFTLDSTTNGNPNNSYYVFALYTEDGDPRGIVYRRIIVPPTPTPTTLGALAIYSAAEQVALPNTYYTATVIDGFFSALVNMATKMTTSIFGAGRLSFAAVSAGDPIVVGHNDPLWRATRKTYYLESYGHSQAGLAAAIADIGANVRELVITSSVHVSATISIPSNITVKFAGEGNLSVATGQTVTIGSMGSVEGMGQLFAADGNVVFAKNATNGRFSIAWWAGRTPSGDLTHAFDQARTSLVNGSGGRLTLGSGNWLQTNFIVPNGTILDGSGQGDGTTTGTSIGLFDTGSATATVRISENYRDIEIRNLAISTGVSTASRGLLIEGTSPNAGFGVLCHKVLFHGTGVGAPAQAHIKDIGGGQFQSTQIKFDQCTWITPANGIGIQTDTVNSLVEIDQGVMSLGANATGIYGNYIGDLTVTNTEFAGTGFSALLWNTTLNRTIAGSITSGTKDLLITTGSLTKNDEGMPVIIAGKLNSYIDQVIDGTHAHVHDNATADAAAAALAVYRITENTARAHCSIHIVNSHGQILLENNTDEGVNHSVINDGSDQGYPLVMIGNAFQGRIQLNQTMSVHSEGNHWSSQQWADGASAQAVITSIGDRIVTTCLENLATYGTRTLIEPRMWGQHSGGSIMAVAFNNTYPVYRQSIGMPTDVLYTTPFVTVPTLPVFGSYADVDTTGGPNDVPVLGFGYSDPVTGKPKYYYYFTRKQGASDAGFAWLYGNQGYPYRGCGVQGAIVADTFRGGVTSPAQITANGAVLTPADYFQFCRITSDANRTVAGITFPNVGSAPKSGDAFQATNVGSFVITLLDQDGTGATSGFLTPDGNGLAVPPKATVSGWYDATLHLWHVAVLGSPITPAYVAATVTYNNTAALANIADLSRVVSAKGIYRVELEIFSANAVKSLNLDFGGTASFTYLIGQWTANLDDNTTIAGAQVIAAGTDFSAAAMDTHGCRYRFEGTMEINAAGTFIPRGAQRTADASNTTVLRGSSMKLTRIG